MQRALVWVGALKPWQAILLVFAALGLIIFVQGKLSETDGQEPIVLSPAQCSDYGIEDSRTCECVNGRLETWRSEENSEFLNEVRFDLEAGNYSHELAGALADECLPD